MHQFFCCADKQMWLLLYNLSNSQTWHTDAHTVGACCAPLVVCMHGNAFQPGMHMVQSKECGIRLVVSASCCNLYVTRDLAAYT